MPGFDPFLMQLFIVPAVVIGVGVFVSSLTKKVVLARSSLYCLICCMRSGTQNFIKIRREYSHF